MSSRLLIAAGILLLISGCAAVQKESPEAYAARLQASCTEAGFQRDTENYRLCLLIQVRTSAWMQSSSSSAMST